MTAIHPFIQDPPRYSEGTGNQQEIDRNTVSSQGAENCGCNFTVDWAWLPLGIERAVVSGSLGSRNTNAATEIGRTARRLLLLDQAVEDLQQGVDDGLAKRIG